MPNQNVKRRYKQLCGGTRLNLYAKPFFLSRSRLTPPSTPARQQSFDIFADDVDLQIDAVAGVLETQRRQFCGVRDHGDRERGPLHVGDGQTDAVYGNGTFPDDIAKNGVGSVDRYPPAVPFFALGTDTANGVHVAAYEVSADAGRQLQGPLQVDLCTRLQVSQIGHVQRFRGHIGRELGLGQFDHGQADTVHADTVSQRSALQHGGSGYGQPGRACFTLERLDASQFFHDPGEHVLFQERQQHDLDAPVLVLSFVGIIRSRPA